VLLWILGSLAQKSYFILLKFAKDNIDVDNNYDLFLDLTSYFSPADFLTIHPLSSLGMKCNTAYK